MRYLLVAFGFALSLIQTRCTPRAADCVPARLDFGAHGTGSGQFVEPRAIAASPGGKVFVIDRTGRVQRFDQHGQFEHKWIVPDTSPENGKPSGIAVDPKGRVLVADTHQHRILMFDQDGAELFRFGGPGRGPGQFMLPTDVQADRDGNYYVAEFGGNDRVQKFDRQGRYILSFGDLSSGTGSLQRPAAVAIDGQGMIWIADASNHRVCGFSPDGTLRRTIGGLGIELGKLRYPRDVVVIKGGTLAVVDYGNNRIAYFDQHGKYSGCWGRPGRGPQGLYMPINAAAIGNVLYIADSKNHRVVRLDSATALGTPGTIASAAIGIPGKEIQP